MNMIALVLAASTATTLSACAAKEADERAPQPAPARPAATGPGTVIVPSPVQPPAEVQPPHKDPGDRVNPGPLPKPVPVPPPPASPRP
ncbi:hypothetical protein GCM10022211_11300 [Sphingomonas humi]|uniref:Lipoprotein n=1 Tax=Sphingomonas humi TaxID=335630 RepID=A0ABP7RTM3_9SPHN